MCGIFGYVTNKETELGPILIAAAERLTYRGYDSVGAATINDGKIDLRKDTGKVDSVAANITSQKCAGSAASHNYVGQPLVNLRKLILNHIWIQTVTWSAHIMAM